MILFRLIIIIILFNSLVACKISSGLPETEGIDAVTGCYDGTVAVKTGLVRGYACYQDRYVDNNVAKTQYKPIRYARVEILAEESDALVGYAMSDEQGYFEISTDGLADNNQYRVRVVSKGALSTTESLVVAENLAPYAIASGTTLYGSSAAVVELQLSNKDHASIFNIFDQFIDAQLYLTQVAGISNIPPIRAVWYAGNEMGSFFCPKYFNYDGCEMDTMYILGMETDSDAFDDMIILHEFGHFVMGNFSYDDSPGGVHYLDDTDQDLRLSWSEGFSTAFAAMVRRHHGYNNPDEMADTDGQGNVLYNFFIEVPTGGKNVFSPRTQALGLANELAVSVVLYDVADDTTNDEAFDLLEEEPLIYSALADMKTRQDISMQDFYEVWSGSSLLPVLEDRKIFVTEDQYEFSGPPTQLSAVSTPVELLHTLHQRDDEDWVKVSLNANQSYNIRTTDFLSGAQALFTLYESDGITPATNAISGSPVNGYFSSLQFMVDSPSEILVHIKRNSASPEWVRYGSYTLQVN